MTKTNISDRINFASIGNQIDYPDFLDIQLETFNSFFQLGTTSEERKKEGLYQTFDGIFPITDSRRKIVLELK